jgi:alpha-glucosidase (family GH31 glycosyl hydrolase)
VSMGFGHVGLLRLLPVALAFIAVKAQSTVDPNSRLDCWPQPSPSKAACLARKCIWDDSDYPQMPTTPLCYYPQDTGYIIKSQSGNTAQLVKGPSSVKNPYDKDIEPLTFTYKQIGAGIHLTIGTKDRYVPPVQINSNPTLKSNDQLSMVLSNGSSTFHFKIQRNSTRENVWDTSIGGLLFGDKYIQIATYLPTDRIFGFGENIHHELKHDLTKYTTWGMFARDHGPDSYDLNTQNLYGVHPFYIGIEEDGRAHGVFIFNSNAQEVTTGPAPHLVYRTIGGQLDIFFFPGPTPEEVIRQYQQVIGTPFLPAYWALGFQFCRWGYKDLQDMKDTVKRIQDANIPIDIAYADIDYMENFRDFTLGQEKWGDFPKFAEQLHSEDMHLFLIFDPAVEADYDSFQRAMEQKAKFIEWPRADLVPQIVQSKYPMAANTTIMLGVVWPNAHVGFPDFLDPSNVTNKWWINEFVQFHKTLPFDGIWIDMNEPSNFGTNLKNPGYPAGHPYDLPLNCPLNGSDSTYDVPPYPTINVFQWGSNMYLSTDTLCMFGKTVGGTGLFYNTKNLYGLSESIATSQALYASTKKRGAVVTRSSYASSGHYAGHWLGDNTSRWPDLRTSIIGTQEFNMFGIPYVGADVCGFLGTTNEELCLRWQQLGSFHSFYRNHNSEGNPPQDPSQWPSVAKATRQANLWRYRHLPYLYTLHFKASRFGGTVVRPVFFEFPRDLATPSLSYQFMWGEAIIVIPVLYPGVSSVDGYLPVEASWYSLSDVQYGELFLSGRGSFYAPTNKHIPVFVRGGHIVPRQKPSITLPASRKNEWQLLVALRQKNEKKPQSADGELYWDDGDGTFDDIEQYDFTHFTYTFSTNKTLATLVVTAKKLSKSITFPKLGQIEVLGYENKPNLQQATLNGKPLPIDTQHSTYSPFTKVLSVVPSSFIDFNTDGPTWTITWKNYF